MPKVIGFDTASTITPAILDKAIADGADYVELYEKYSTPTLVILIQSKGLGIAPIYETSAERALAGEAAGETDAQAFLASVPARFGVSSLPAEVAPAYAVDFDVTTEQQPDVLAYGQGWKTGMAGKLRSRIYGNGAVCEAAKDAGLVDFTWTAGGSGMRGTATYLQSNAEDEKQDVGDKENLDLPISVDTEIVETPDLSWIWWPQGDPRQVAPAALAASQAATAALANKGAPSPPLSAAAGAVVATAPILPDLKTAQLELQAKGLYQGEIDGIWSPQSEAAFAAFYQS